MAHMPSPLGSVARAAFEVNLIGSAGPVDEDIDRFPAIQTFVELAGVALDQLARGFSRPIDLLKPASWRRRRHPNPAGAGGPFHVQDRMGAVLAGKVQRLAD